AASRSTTPPASRPSSASGKPFAAEAYLRVAQNGMNVHSYLGEPATMSKTILITGATAGIGRHAALELARRGHHVIATGRREQALDELAREARGIEGGGRLDTLRLDVTDDEAVEASVARVLE